MITAEDVNGVGNGSSGSFNVGPAGLDHFIFSVVGTQVSGEPFDITIKAKDVTETRSQTLRARPF